MKKTKKFLFDLDVMIDLFDYNGPERNNGIIDHGIPIELSNLVTSDIIKICHLLEFLNIDWRDCIYEVDIIKSFDVPSYLLTVHLIVYEEE